MSRLMHAAANGDEVQAALTASGVVGLWTYDTWTDHLVLSGALAEILDPGQALEQGQELESGQELDPGQEAAAPGMPLETLLSGIHDEDRARVENVVHAAIVGCAPFDVAFRTARGGRTLSLRGRIECDGAGQPRHGRGIALDLTHEEGLDRPAQHAVNRMAEHAIALHGLVGHLHRPALARLLDGLMREIGRELARHLRDAAGERRH